ncbi:MAG: hypothetical protein V7640_2076, partial [Betaproteobacteria bacterium]
MHSTERATAGAQHRKYRHIEVRPIAGALGAVVRGIDVSQPL